MSDTRYWAVPIGSDWFQLRSGPKRPMLRTSILKVKGRDISIKRYVWGRRIGTVRYSVITNRAILVKDAILHPNRVYGISKEFLDTLKKEGKIT